MERKVNNNRNALIVDLSEKSKSSKSKKTINKSEH
jgi:hypothetical protein